MTKLGFTGNCKYLKLYDQTADKNQIGMTKNMQRLWSRIYATLLGAEFLNKQFLNKNRDARTRALRERLHGGEPS